VRSTGERDRFEDLPILGELRDVLQDRLWLAGEQPQRGGRVRRWLRRRSRLVVVLAVVLVGGGSALAAGLFSGEQSAPLTDVLSGGSMAGTNYDIGLYPNLEAGVVGWCSTETYGKQSATAFAPTVGGGSSCGAVSAAIDTPIFAACGCGGTGPWYVLTSARVAAVRIAGGPTIRTRPDRRLPFGFRAAVSTEAFRAPLARVTALDRAGRPIADTQALTAPEPTRSWRAPAHPAAGICSLIPAPSLGLRPTHGTVVTRIIPQPGLLEDAFIPCLNIEYLIPHGSPINRYSAPPPSPAGCDGARNCTVYRPTILAIVLLDARHPGRSLPDLPGMQPIAGAPGYLDDPAAPDVVDGMLTGFTAKRSGESWLIVAGGSGTAQRLTALRQMTIGTLNLRTTTARRAPAGSRT
jgi:hypothetical protein